MFSTPVHLRPARTGSAFLAFIGIFAVIAAVIWFNENQPASLREAIGQLEYGDYQLTMEKVAELDVAKALSQGSAKLLGVSVPANVIRQALTNTRQKAVLGRLVSHGDVRGTYFYTHYLVVTKAIVPETDRFVIRHGKKHGYIVGRPGRLEYIPDRFGSPGWSAPDPRDYQIAIGVMEWDGEWKEAGSGSSRSSSDRAVWRRKVSAHVTNRPILVSVDGGPLGFGTVIIAEVCNDSDRTVAWTCKFRIARARDGTQVVESGRMSGTVPPGQTKTFESESFALPRGDLYVFDENEYRALD